MLRYSIITLFIFGTFTGLTQLIIPSHSGISDVGISKLMNIKDLFILNLTRTRITDAAIPTLTSLSNIARLDIQGTAITPAGVAQLKTAHPNWIIMYP